MTRHRPSPVKSFAASAATTFGSYMVVLCLGMSLAFALCAPSVALADSSTNSFKTKCSPVFAQPKQMDPIVSPGQTTGHLHEFFGNTTINPNSTGQQLQTDGAMMHTTCADAQDTANYWVPTLYRNGVRVVPVGIDVYYKRAESIFDASSNPLTMVTEPPVDFRMIEGDKTATAPQPSYIVHWNCLGDNNIQSYTAPPACYNPSHAATAVSGQVIFPACWDGGSDLLANNANNVAYERSTPSGAQCPAGFGTLIPKLLLTVHYDQDPRPDCTLVTSPNPGVNCDTYTLSEFVNGSPNKNGSIYGYHADWLNGWSNGPDNNDNPPLDFNSLIQRCDNPPNNTPACGTQASTPPGDAFVNYP